MNPYPRDKVLRSYKIFSANNEAVIYCKNRIPVSILGQSLAQQAVDDPTRTESLFDFLENECGQHTAYQITHVRVEIAANCTFPTFPYEANAPVLVLEDTGYNADDQPIWHKQQSCLAKSPDSSVAFFAFQINFTALHIQITTPPTIRLLQGQ